MFKYNGTHYISQHNESPDIINQHGFRDGHSYASQLINLTENLLHALDHQKLLTSYS